MSEWIFNVVLLHLVSWIFALNVIYIDCCVCFFSLGGSDVANKIIPSSTSLKRC
jgi:hypothetical protein